MLPGDNVPSDRDAIVTDLARCDVLTAATRADLESLAKLLTPFAAPAGTVLFRRGDVAGHFLLMTSGRARIAFGEEEEGAQKVSAVAEGSILGEMALLRGTRRSATITAITETRGLKGGRPAFTRLLAIPGVLEKVVATARQRLAADMVPVPVTLRDGTAAGLRPVYPGDQQELMRGELFSAQTRYRRFLGREQVTPALARYLTEVDYVDHFAWVALGADVWAGGATYVRSASDRALADISFLITDEFQGRGLGTLLMGAVAIAARRNGIARFSADVLAENAPMRAILNHADIKWETVEAGVMHGCVAVPDPARSGIAPGTAAALAAVVEEMKIRL